MHELRMNPTRVLISAIALTFFAVAPAVACERLWVGDRELWSADGDQARLLVSDARGVDNPAWSPSRDRVAYAHEFRFDANGAAAEIVVVDRAGQAVRSLSIDPDLSVNAIMSVGWRSDRRVYAVGHVNPSTSMYLEWDLNQGRLVESIPGSAFAVSPDGRSLAYRAHVPHGAQPPYDASTLMIDGNAVWPSESDHGYHRFTAGPAWSENGRIAIVDETESATDLVIIDRRRNAVERTPLDSAIHGRVLSWDGPDALELRNGEDSWRIDAATGRAERAPRVPAAESIEPPASLRERGAKLRMAASRCKE